MTLRSLVALRLARTPTPSTTFLCSVCPLDIPSPQDFLQEPGPQRCARCDALMLRRALSNLLSNAIRYTPRGQTVTVRLSERNSVAVVNVENPGPPIAAEHLSHLFDRFYRVDPARQRNGDGAGLGLAIVKSIAQAHGGAVQAHSDAVLTCFELTLPRARSS